MYPNIRRRSACTHVTMKRIYGLHTCDICHHPSKLGWVYICTQDSPNPELCLETSLKEENNRYGSLSALSSSSSITSSDPNDMEICSILKPWMQKAVIDGLYTPEQMRILARQKIKVVDTIDATVNSRDGGRSSANIATPPLNAPLLSSTLDEELVPLTSASIAIAQILSSVRPTSQPQYIGFPICKFRSCQRCRPTFRDRTWQSFDEVYAKDADTTLAAEQRNIFNERSVGSVSLVKTMGLDKSVETPSSPYSREILESSSLPTESSDQSLTQTKHEIVPRVGIDLSRSEDITDESDTQPKGSPSKKISPLQEKAKSVCLDADVDIIAIGCGLNDSNQEGTSLSTRHTPVISPAKNSAGKEEPAHLDKDDGTSNRSGEIMTEGVAVKEESVCLGSPDIIMSA